MDVYSKIFAGHHVTAFESAMVTHEELKQRLNAIIQRYIQRITTCGSGTQYSVFVTIVDKSIRNAIAYTVEAKMSSLSVDKYAAVFGKLATSNEPDFEREHTTALRLLYN